MDKFLIGKTAWITGGFTGKCQLDVDQKFAEAAAKTPQKCLIYLNEIAS